ncbi:MAG: acyl-CoA thioesterase [Planctomycetes bacterium]|nr:acyl-CoA thioesterase [Planctomycetota bacterium]
MPYDAAVRVRYAETDQMGVVYHSNYLIYFEIGRTEAMRQIGIAYADLEKRGYLLAVIESGCRHYGSARYDDLLTVRTRLTEAGKTRLRFEYEVLLDGRRLATGHTVLACLNRAEGMRPTRLPEDVDQAAQRAVESA